MQKHKVVNVLLLNWQDNRSGIRSSGSCRSGSCSSGIYSSGICSTGNRSSGICSWGIHSSRIYSREFAVAEFAVVEFAVIEPAQSIVNTLQLTCSCLLFWAPCWFEHLTQKIFCLLVCYTVGAIVFLVDLFDELTLLLLSRACFWNKTVWKFLSQPLSHIDGFYITICQVAYVVFKKTENYKENVINRKF